jgi:hypothetical protein
MDFGAETVGRPPDFRPLCKGGKRRLFTTGDRYTCANEFDTYIVREVGEVGEVAAYAPPLPNFQTGMPSFRALSARFS